VEWIVKRLCGQWGNGARYVIDAGDHPHEAHYLKLDCAKARMGLDWHPRWGLEKTLSTIIEWVSVYRSAADIRCCCLEQIADYENLILEPK
jgi:CDP-glucose 4,6-dehydratase